MPINCCSLSKSIPHSKLLIFGCRCKCKKEKKKAKERVHLEETAEDTDGRLDSSMPAFNITGGGDGPPSDESSAVEKKRKKKKKKEKKR